MHGGTKQRETRSQDISESLETRQSSHTWHGGQPLYSNGRPVRTAPRNAGSTQPGCHSETLVSGQLHSLSPFTFIFSLGGPAHATITHPRQQVGNRFHVPWPSSPVCIVFLGLRGSSWDGSLSNSWDGTGTAVELWLD